MTHLVFTKGSGKHDRMDVLRQGAVVESIECPKQGIIPHDMVHYAVESTLRKRGFIGRVLSGEGASFRMESEPESDGVERFVEVVQADGGSGWGSAPTDMLELYRVTCEARQCEPLGLDVADIEAVRQRILELSARWHALGIGQSLALRPWLVEPAP